MRSPTHTFGQTLDILIPKSLEKDLIITTYVCSDTPSDNSCINIVIFPNLKHVKTQVNVRKLNAIKLDLFTKEIQLADFGSDNEIVDRLVDIYNSNLFTVLY